MHDALWDARNTAELFRLTRNQEEFLKSMSLIQDMVNQEDEVCSCALGEMFNFSSIRLA